LDPLPPERLLGKFETILDWKIRFGNLHLRLAKPMT